MDGVFVARVEHESLAEAVGLEVGDEILAVNNVLVHDKGIDCLNSVACMLCAADSPLAVVMTLLKVVEIAVLRIHKASSDLPSDLISNSHLKYPSALLVRRCVCKARKPLVSQLRAHNLFHIFMAFRSSFPCHYSSCDQFGRGLTVTSPIIFSNIFA